MNLIDKNEPIEKPTGVSAGEPDQVLGLVLEWYDAKGYGWVGADGGRIFAHIKEFERGRRRPKTGDKVRFSIGRDSQGRTCAKKIRLMVQSRSLGLANGLVLAGLLLLPVIAGMQLPVPAWGIPAWMFGSSLVTGFLYESDKRRAELGRWRVSERALHFAELLGGWPGAYIAQRKLRHKTRKVGFLVVSWLIVGIHQFVAVDILRGYPMGDWLLEWLRRQVGS